MMNLANKITPECSLDDLEAGIDRAIAIKPVVTLNIGKL